MARNHTQRIPTLQGLSTSDRDLMLAMMAALGSAAQTMIATSADINAEQPVKAMLLVRRNKLDAEANSLIDLCKRAKDRLKPGSAVILN